MKSFLAILFLGLFVEVAAAQEFSLAAYEEFLASHKDMTSSQLLSLYSAGLFKSQAQTNYSNAEYFDSIEVKYSLTADEKSLLAKNGFVVTERLDSTQFSNSFGNAFLDVYNKDLPVFVSTDAILHSIHMSYDAILMNVEQQILIGDLKTLLANLHNQLPALVTKYSADAAMKMMLNDVDVYLTVPQVILGSATGPTYSGNAGVVDTLLSLIAAEQPANYPIFSSTPRTIDFSQFTPRGHYTATVALTQYFQAMMWLGRIEIYLIAPVSADPPQTDTDIQRQTIDAVLIKELADTSNSFPLLDQIDGIIKFFVGDQDNVTLPNIDSLAQEINLHNASELLDTLRWRAFQDTLAAKPYAFQRILSQILMSDPLSPERIETASSFLLLGQRFVIDSYVMGNVVYDKIVVNGVPIKRMLPSSLDVLFAEGNNGAAQLLQPDLDYYQYSSNLAALRYLIGSYGQDFWQESIYNSWSNAIRSLNPPANRDSLPAFMQTAAWWQEKMNTQLASWAQLRHDNLLYAKQSYSGGIPVCSFPESYVEPFPEFYDAVKSYAAIAQEEFEQPLLQNIVVANYFGNLKAIADTLGNISREELSGTPVQESEKAFLRAMMFTQDRGGCVPFTTYNGWYPELFYGWASGTDNNSPVEKNLVVADVHTAPTDSMGYPVGWVFHVGTGPINMAVVVATLPGGEPTAFVGPVMSYYEHLSVNFQRLTDEEWQTMYNVSPSLRPSWVNIYLADTTGSARSAGLSLLTGIKAQPSQNPLPATLTLAQNFPNPFNPSTIIAFSVPQSLSHSRVAVTIYNDLGQLVKKVFTDNLPAGNYTVRWDGTDVRGTSVASGVYFCRVTAGGMVAIRKMLLLR
jgi:hypothetical protein